MLIWKRWSVQCCGDITLDVVEAVYANDAPSDLSPWRWFGHTETRP